MDIPTNIQHQTMGYDRTATMFSPEGHLLQVEYAEKTVRLGVSSIGMICSDGVFIIADKRVEAGVELHEPKIMVEVPVTDVTPVEIDKPIDHRPENSDSLYEYRVINLRNTTEQGIFRIQAAVGDAIRDYLKSLDFVEFHSPKLLAGSTEGGAEVFKLDHFGKEATLAQSAQFYKQIMVGVFERAFEFGATYRAEPSTTSRHMTEFITVDLEMGFIESSADVRGVLDGLMNYVSEYVWKTCESELKALGAVKPALTQKLPEITLKELHELYFKETGEDARKDPDPTPAEERFVSEYSAKNWKSDAVYITEFPSSHMKFYHFRDEKNPDVADRADLIFRGVEIITTSRREHRHEKLIEQLKEFGGNPENLGYKYFLQAFQYGMPPHGGAGLGLERLTQKIIGLANVKEATLFPRDMNRLAP